MDGKVFTSGPCPYCQINMFVSNLGKISQNGTRDFRDIPGTYTRITYNHGKGRYLQVSIKAQLLTKVRHTSSLRKTQ